MVCVNTNALITTENVIFLIVNVLTVKIVSIFFFFTNNSFSKMYNILCIFSRVFFLAQDTIIAMIYSLVCKLKNMLLSLLHSMGKHMNKYK